VKNADRRGREQGRVTREVAQDAGIGFKWGAKSCEASEGPVRVNCRRGWSCSRDPPAIVTLAPAWDRHEDAVHAHESAVTGDDPGPAASLVRWHGDRIHEPIGSWEL